jgi:ABC-type ATPase involved in cell division
MNRDDIADARRRIGVVHQDCQFLDHLSVADNVALPLMVSGAICWREGANLEELINWVGLSAAPPPAARAVGRGTPARRAGPRGHHVARRDPCR